MGDLEPQKPTPQRQAGHWRVLALKLHVFEAQLLLTGGPTNPKTL